MVYDSVVFQNSLSHTRLENDFMTRRIQVNQCEYSVVFQDRVDSIIKISDWRMTGVLFVTPPTQIKQCEYHVGSRLILYARGTIRDWIASH